MALAAGALLGLLGLGAVVGAGVLGAGMLQDWEIRANIRGFANVDPYTEAFWAEDQLEPKRPVTATYRRLDASAAGLGSDYVAVYGDLLDPWTHEALAGALALAETTDVRLFLKHQPQDGAGLQAAACFERLLATDRRAARRALAHLTATSNLTGRLDTVGVLELLGQLIRRADPDAPIEAGCAEGRFAAMVSADQEEAYAFGFAQLPAYVVNGLRVNEWQTGKALAALVAYARVQAADRPAERGPPEAWSAEP